jgi:hypothetical protein
MVQGLEPCGDAAAVAFEAELAFQGPDDGLDALSDPVRERARSPSTSGNGSGSTRSRVLYSLWASSRGNRCPTRRGAARSQCRSPSWRSRTCATARQASSASVTSGGLPGPRRPGPRRDDPVGQFHVSAVRRVSRSAVMTGSRIRTCGLLGRSGRPCWWRAAAPAIWQSRCSPVLTAPCWCRSRGGGAACGAGQRSLPALSQAM